MIDLEEKLRSGMDFGRCFLSVDDLGFSGYGLSGLLDDTQCVIHDVEMSLDTT